ncbi:hypothetical protein M0802_004651 [Mischocyttarus mexicanus]|nr:hypothetical protein M0802_004651 [Mischocyttarus mexicanus]
MPGARYPSDDLWFFQAIGVDVVLGFLGWDDNETLAWGMSFIQTRRRNLFAERQVAYAAAHPAHLRSSFWNSFSRLASPMESAAAAAPAPAAPTWFRPPHLCFCTFPICQANDRLNTCFTKGPVGEVGGVRLPLQSLHGYGSVFMYSSLTSPGGGGGQAGGGGGEVTLRLREPEDIPEEVLARLEDTATLSISLQGDAVLRLGAAAAGNGSLELFDSESGPDLTLSPQTFTSTAEAFINDNSDSLGVPGDNDTGSSEESKAGTGDPGKRGVKRPRSKASSPVRQGPQQCQVLAIRAGVARYTLARSRSMTKARSRRWTPEDRKEEKRHEEGRRKARSNDVCLALEEGPSEGERSGFWHGDDGRGTAG